MNVRIAHGKLPPVVRLVIAVVIAVVIGLSALGQRPHAQGRPQTNGSGIETIRLRPNVYMLAGAGANIVAHVGWMGVVLVDTGSANMSDQILAAIQRITDQKIRFIINTTADADHVGGNAALARAGRNLLLYNEAPGFAGFAFQTNRGAAGIMAQENVLNRMSATVGDKPAFPGESWPTEPFTGNRVKSLYLNGDGVQVFHQPRAHSDSDSVVVFRRADVIASGPIVDLRTFPVIDLERGGSIGGLITALNNLVEMSIPPAPLNWHEDRTLIVPAYGRAMDQADAVEYRDMVVVIRDRVHDLITKGMTLEQIRKADPAKGYRGQYGPEAGRWTNDMFITAIYRSLTAKS